MSNHKKPRKEIIKCKSDKKIAKLSITYDSKRDLLTMPDADINTISVERSYKRSSGKDKVLSSIPGVGMNAAFDVNSMLVKEYDYIMAIDTNSRVIDGNKVSICTCCMVLGSVKQFTTTREVSMSCDSFLIFNPLETLNPEQIGWFLAIKYLLTLPFDNGRGKLALIVDSEKDSLPKFNSRSLPFFLNHYLDKQLKFCYASDKDTDTISGILLKQCHLRSNELVRAFQKNKLNLSEKVQSPDYCDWYSKVNLSQ